MSRIGSHDALYKRRTWLVSMLVSFQLLVLRSDVHSMSLKECRDPCSPSDGIQQRQTNAACYIIGASSNGSGVTLRRATLSDKGHLTKTVCPLSTPINGIAAGLELRRDTRDEGVGLNVYWQGQILMTASN